MKPILKNRFLIALSILGAAQLPITAQVTGLRQHQVINMSVGSGEVVSFSPNFDTLAVTDNSAGGVRLFRHNGTAFAPHAAVDFAAYFTSNPVAGFVYSDVTSVSLAADGSGIGVATAINGSTVVVGVTNYTTTVPQIGRAVFFNLETGAIIGSIPVGYQPDMVTIKNGKVAIANEAEHAWAGSGAVNIAAFDSVQQPGSVSVIDITGLTNTTLPAALATLTATTTDFSGVTSLISGLRDHTSFDPANTKAKFFHIEPEYITFSPDNTQLFVGLQENNAIAVLDLATNTWSGITGLGQRDITIDASDSDRSFDVTNVCKGLPMPDSIATWTAAGSTYIITADEGDARVDDGDIQRFASAFSTYGLASGFTPSTSNNDFGRLNVLRDQSLNGPVFPTTSPNSDLDKIVSMGTRGLSLWKKEADNSVSFVSHLPLENELFKLDPLRHNANNGGIRADFDTRSDDKGPEPESVAVTKLADGTVIAVAGMERQNGVIIADITNPLSPKVVRYINSSDRGLISPETVQIIDPVDSPTNTMLAIVGFEGIVGNSIAGGVGVYEINGPSFRLQVLHASDMEADVTSLTTASQFAALADKLEDAPGNDASITIGAGDCFIPGAFLSAGNDSSTRNALKTALGFTFGFNASGSATDLRENPGRPDIAIMNAIGFDATCIGNHEFDLGATEFGNIVVPDARTSTATMRHYGAAFPFLSANLDFSAAFSVPAAIPDLAPYFTSEIRNVEAFRPNPNLNYSGLSAAPTRAKLAKSTIVERGGEKIGILGVTPPDLANISSPGLVTVTGPTGAVVVSPRTYDINALAAHLQPTINALVAAGCNKIVLATQLQQIDNEKLLATKLRHVDIIVAGGSGTIYSNSGILQPGDTSAGAYPFSTTDLDGNTVAIVSGDGQYHYLGRLVVDFNAAGQITMVNNLSDNIAVTPAAVTAQWGVTDPYAANTRGGTVKTVTDALASVINLKDGLILGKSAVYLEGRRTNVRQQETNFGNLSADANLWYAKNVDSTVAVSLKNGGGIRNSIGAVNNLGVPGITAANASAGKAAGDISRLDVEDSLKFNNALTSLTITHAQLKLLLEHGVAGSNGPGAANNTPGQFCQLGGVLVVADLAETPISYTSASNVISAVNGGSRIRYAALLNSSGLPTTVIVNNGEVVTPTAPVRLVTLTFLANAGSANSDFGGDTYPIPYLARINGSALTNRVDMTTDGSANAFTFTTAGTEQDAFAEYVKAFHGTTPTAYSIADTVVGLDRRIIQGTTDSDLDGLSNAIEVASLGLNPDAANTSSQINSALLGLRTAGRTDVTSNPSAFSLYTASSIQDLRGTGNLLIQAQGANVTLTLPVQKSTTLGAWESAGALNLTFPKIENKEFYRFALPQ